MATDSLTGHLVVIGASAGGISALMVLAQTLPAGFPAPICIVQHVGSNHSILPELLSGKGPHPAVHARDRPLLTPGVLVNQSVDWFPTAKTRAGVTARYAASSFLDNTNNRALSHPSR